MKYFLLFIILFNNKGISQSLTTEETLNYLNNLSIKYPGMGNHDSFIDVTWNSNDSCTINVSYYLSYDQSKTRLSIQEKYERFGCKYNPAPYKLNANGKLSKYGNLYRIDLRDFNVNNIELTKTKYYNKINLEGEILEYHYDTTKNSYFLGLGKLNSQLSLSVINNSYAKVFYNGLKYLVTIAKQQISEVKDEIVDDPFLKQNSSSEKSSKTKYVISLGENNGILTINVKIGGKIGSNFILDTGAGECNISSELEKILLSNGLIKNSDYINNGLYKLADGTITENRRVNLSRIQIGNKTFTNIIASIGPPGSPNLLGQTFLKKLNVWSIDNSKKELIIN